MKRRKLVGITLIATSILLQVGYATRAGQITNTVSTKAFKVDFEANPVITQTEEMDVTAQVGEGIVTITANNLYPGAEFSVTPTVRNNGEYQAKVTHIEIVEKTGQVTALQLLDAMVGYAGYKDIEAYNNELSKTYVGQVIDRDKILALPIKLGLKGEETGFQNTSAQFDIRIEFEQEEVNHSGGGGTQEPNDPDGPSNPNNPSNPQVPSLPEQVVDIPDEEVPLGAATEEPVIEPTPQLEIELPDEEIVIPKGVVPSGMLPKTGGVTPFVVYGLGIALLGSGIVIYRKKDE